MDFVVYSMDTPSSEWSEKKRKTFINDQRNACRKKLGISVVEETLFAMCLSLGHGNYLQLC